MGRSDDEPCDHGPVTTARWGVAGLSALGYFAPMSIPAEVKIVLASASPRRSELLRREGVEFEIIPADIEEVQKAGEAPAALATRLASEKALAVAKRLGADPPRWVLGADTIVVIDESVLGKPTDPKNAEHLLSRLSGRTHSVITGFAWVNSDGCRVNCDWIESRVSMRDVGAEAIRAYVDTGEPMDKAGAYAVQGMGGKLVEKVEGSLDNVIGLPVQEVLERFATLGDGA